MKELAGIAEQIAAKLVARKQTIAVAESSTGGLISAALLSVPGASAYFLGGAVVYTRDARRLLMDIPDEAMKGIASPGRSCRRGGAAALCHHRGYRNHATGRPAITGDAAGHSHGGGRRGGDHWRRSRATGRPTWRHRKDRAGFAAEEFGGDAGCLRRLPLGTRISTSCSGFSKYRSPCGRRS